MLQAQNSSSPVRRDCRSQADGNVLELLLATQHLGSNRWVRLDPPYIISKKNEFPEHNLDTYGGAAGVFCNIFSKPLLHVSVLIPLSISSLNFRIVLSLPLPKS